MVGRQVFLVLLHVQPWKPVSEIAEVLHGFWPFPLFLPPTSPRPFWIRYCIPHSSVSPIRDLVGKPCLKLAFPFPHFEISVFPWLFFFLSCCPVLTVFLTDFQWTFSDFLTLWAFRQWFAGNVSLSANTFQQCFSWDNKHTAELWIWVCRKGRSRWKKVWCPEIRFLSRTISLSRVRQPFSSVSHLWWTAGSV